jgi:adenosine deaminase
MFRAFISDEYERCRRTFGFDDRRIAELAGNGVRASFAPDPLRAELEGAIGEWLRESSNPIH